MVCRTCPDQPEPIRTFRTKKWERADEATREKGKADGYRLSTYLYEEDTLLWKMSKWRPPVPDEFDQVMGLPARYTALAKATILQHEQMIGNSMHVAAIQRVLKDVPLPNQEPSLVVPPPDNLPPTPVNTTSILQALWDQLTDKSFENVSKEGFTIQDIDTTVEPHTYKDMPKPMTGILPDVPKPHLPEAKPPPLNFVAPPKEEVENISA